MRTLKQACRRVAVAFAVAGLIGAQLAIMGGTAHADVPAGVANVKVQKRELIVQVPVNGQDNKIALLPRQTPDGEPSIEVIDLDDHELRALDGCSYLDLNDVGCPLRDTTEFFVSVADGNDTVANFVDLPGQIIAGPGNDTVLDGPGDQQVQLDQGDDMSRSSLTTSGRLGRRSAPRARRHGVAAGTAY